MQLQPEDTNTAINHTQILSISGSCSVMCVESTAPALFRWSASRSDSTDYQRDFGAGAGAVAVSQTRRSAACRRDTDTVNPHRHGLREGSRYLCVGAPLSGML